MLARVLTQKSEEATASSASLLAMPLSSISLLSIPTKLLERIVHNRLLHHLITNSILSPRQFGFQPGSSTQEALLSVTHDWQRNLDHGLSSAALFLVMSKAFDKVPHHHLLHSLVSFRRLRAITQMIRELPFQSFTKSCARYSSTSLPVHSTGLLHYSTSHASTALLTATALLYNTD